MNKVSNLELSEKIAQAVEGKMWNTFTETNKSKSYSKYRAEYKQTPAFVVEQINSAIDFLSPFLALNEGEQIVQCTSFINEKLQAYNLMIKKYSYDSSLSGITNRLLSNALYSTASPQSLALLISVLDNLSIKEVNNFYEKISDNIKVHTKNVSNKNANDDVPQFISDKSNFIKNYLKSKSSLVPILHTISDLNNELVNFMKQSISKEELLDVLSSHDKLIKQLVIYQKYSNIRARNLAEFETISHEINRFSSVSRSIFSKIENIVSFSDIFTVEAYKINEKTENTQSFNFTNFFSKNIKALVQNVSTETFYSLASHFKSNFIYTPDAYSLFKSLVGLEARPTGFVTKVMSRHSIKDLLQILSLSSEDFTKSIIVFYSMDIEFIKKKFLEFEKLDMSALNFQLEIKPENSNAITLEVLKLMKLALPEEKYRNLRAQDKKAMAEQLNVLLDKKMLELSVEAAAGTPIDDSKKFKI